MDFLNFPVPAWIILVYLAFNALVQALPSPKELGGVVSPWYLFLFRAMHGLALNFKLLVKQYEGRKGEPK